jgi:hypothetical protein
MSKNSTAVSEKQYADNPLVLIKYEPENALALLSQAAKKSLATVQAEKITNVKQLESASVVLQDAEIRMEQIETFTATLREKVQRAAEKFREIPGFEDFEVTLTIRKWALKSSLGDAIRNLKTSRAQYLSAEKEKLRRAQWEADERQRKANEAAAKEAAKAAREAGADRQAVAAIKQEVLSTPAPIVESKAANVAQEMGATLRYQYTAQITDLKKFLGLCLNNEVFLNTLRMAQPDIEKAFRKMASDQKEAFNYPGISFVKTPVDVSRRA